jgi:hydroxypyruvate reductase
MQRSATQLRADAERIWRAGVKAVLPETLVHSHVTVDGGTLVIDDDSIDLHRVERIAIVGAGKAAGALTASLEGGLGPRLLIEKKASGWVNVPADCLVPTNRVHLHAARPAGVNEPRPEGVEGTRRILELVASLGPGDLCICVLTGGGSALLPAPAPGISLEEKLHVTRRLSAAGANIRQLNTVRSQLSSVKGGGLARACRAGRLVTLLISDVLGDPLEIIASGPTAANSSTASDALATLEELSLLQDRGLQSVIRWLRHHAQETAADAENVSNGGPLVTHHILGNNATAVDAAGMEAERLGYSHAMISADAPEGPAEEVGRHLAKMAQRMHDEPGPDCLISGGEPTVTLVDESQRGMGGRNQQLALAALEQLGDCENIALLSAGTDGEDGPTDAAGAFVTADVVRSAHDGQLHAREFLRRNDAYHFFQKTGGLFVTGPTQTNVCDLRVVVVSRSNGVEV